MNSILSDLYHGELRPNEHGYPADSDVGILLESFQQNEKWLGDGEQSEQGHEAWRYRYVQLRDIR